MDLDVRPMGPDDPPRLVELALAAWTPVFASVRQALAGSGVFEAQHPDWRVDQQRAVEQACADPDVHVGVADLAGTVVGFVAVGRHADEPIAEIHMVAVDPAHQSRGTGARLVRHALDWSAEQGYATAMVETAGDPGHAPARRLYEQAGFTAFPVVRYFRTVPGGTQRP